LILSKCKSEEERRFYLKLAVEQRWSKRELEQQINQALFERTIASPLKVSTAERIAPGRRPSLQRQLFVRFPACAGTA